MVVDRLKQTMEEVSFREIEHILHQKDRLVFNNTKVIPARLYGTLVTGGAAEVLLIKALDSETPNVWKAFVRPGKKLKKGQRILFPENGYCEVLEELAEGKEFLNFIFRMTVLRSLSTPLESSLYLIISGERGLWQRIETATKRSMLSAQAL